ncbi:Fc.00g046970.m01.CDS01 [Cosmosporella sp. VM-42]
MEKVGIILIVLFLTTIVLGPMPAQPKIYNPQPEDLGQARQKLTSVTTCSSVGSRANQPENVDIEAAAAAAQAEFGECPICIGPLIPEPAHTSGDNAPTSVEAAGVATVKLTVTTTAKSLPGSNGESHEGVVELGRASQVNSLNPSEDDVLTLNTCGHSFHSKCLSSWFLIERYDCPICRLPYYKSRSRTSRPLGVPAFF